MGSDMRKIFANNLRQIIEERGIQQNEIARALNLSEAAVSDWFRGKGFPRIDTLERLAGYLNVLMTDLTMEKGKRDSVAIMLTETERTLISLYRQVPPEKRPGVLKMIEIAVKQL